MFIVAESLFPDSIPFAIFGSKVLICHFHQVVVET